MHAVMHRGRFRRIIADPPVDKRMADGIRDIMVNKAGQKGYGLFAPLPGRNLADAAQAVFKKGIDMVLMHVRAHIAVVAVAQDGNVVKKHIRALQPELVEPAVFGHNVFECGIGHVIVCFHAEDVMGSEAWHGIPSFCGYSHGLCGNIISYFPVYMNGGGNKR